MYRRKRRVVRWYAPLTITAIYLLFGVVWILGSDSLAAAIAGSPEMFRRIEVYKGIAYVAITTVLLFALLNDYARRIGRAFDQTRARREELVETVSEKEALIRELNHRVRNNLQIITAIIRLSENGGGDEQRRYGERILQRIETLAYVQDEQLSNGDLSQAPLASVVDAVVGLLSDDARERGVTIHRMESPCSVTSDATVPYGLILSELLDNAIRYTPDNGGTVSVRVVTSDTEITCAIETPGSGTTPRITDGPGLTIAHAMASHLGGSISHEEGPRGGIRGILRVPVQ